MYLSTIFVLHLISYLSHGLSTLNVELFIISKLKYTPFYPPEAPKQRNIYDTYVKKCVVFTFTYQDLGLEQASKQNRSITVLSCVTVCENYFNKYLKHNNNYKDKLFSGIKKSKETVKSESKYLSRVGRGNQNIVHGS